MSAPPSLSAPPGASGRRLVITAAVMVAAIVVLVVVLSGRRGPSGQLEAAPAPLATTAPPAVSLPPTATAAVGPTTVVGGVPMGYVQSPAGAEAAAVGFLRLDEKLVGMNDEAATAVKRVIAASSSANALAADLVAKLAALRKGYPGGTTTYRIGVLATRVTPATADRVRVELWHVGVISPPGVIPYEDWNTQRYELVWERDDWRVAGEASTPGPRPLSLPRPDPSGPGQLEASLSGFLPAGVGR